MSSTTTTGSPAATRLAATTGPNPFDSDRAGRQGREAGNHGIKTLRLPARAEPLSARAKRDIQLVLRNMTFLRLYAVASRGYGVVLAAVDGMTALTFLCLNHWRRLRAS